MFVAELGSSWEKLGLVLVSAPVAYLALIAFSRLAGLRSFSQMTNFDLAATVAFGSMLATTAVSTEVSLVQGGLALAVLFGVQALTARVRRYKSFEWIFDNRPLLLMRGTEMLPQNIRRAKVTESDIRAKLRLAGVTHLGQVDAVVLETTGDVSVLLKDPEGRPLDPALLSTVDCGDDPSRVKAT
ncbi:uncharacterized protein DUF421 [Haloactinospora alba]|uniref:Uncharacterized protein DUF421 n=1 Tax=Haloactinospora alba TaxID=405555 RepID=A0A543NIK5_9ACTN|nr:YetF domain-containing protein [Haloactinospora alba]TQN31666.1 uncharacterized protein DUF421 [Haloactinospora alba]